jgi:hypothetical protein
MNLKYVRQDVGLIITVRTVSGERHTRTESPCVCFESQMRCYQPYASKHLGILGPVERQSYSFF